MATLASGRSGAGGTLASGRSGVGGTLASGRSVGGGTLASGRSMGGGSTIASSRTIGGTPVVAACHLRKKPTLSYVMTRVPGVTYPKKIVQLPQPRALPSPSLYDSPGSPGSPSSPQLRASPQLRTFQVATDEDLERLRAVALKGRPDVKARILEKRAKHDHFRNSIGATPMDTTKKEQAAEAKLAAIRERKAMVDAARAAEVAAAIQAEILATTPAPEPSDGEALASLLRKKRYERPPTLCDPSSALLLSAIIPVACATVAAISYGAAAVMIAAIAPAVAAAAVLFTPIASAARSLRTQDLLPMTKKSDSRSRSGSASGCAACMQRIAAWSVQLLVGVLAVGQAVVVLTSGSTTLTDVLIVVACCAIQLPDACGWMLGSNSVAASLIARVNEARLHAEATVEQAGEALQASAMATRERLLKRCQCQEGFLDEPEPEEDPSALAQLLARISSFADNTLDELGYHVRLSPLKVLAVTLSIVMAIDWMGRDIAVVPFEPGSAEEEEDAPSVTLLVLLMALGSAAMTAIATTDWVRKHVKPAEFEDGCESDALKREARIRRQTAEQHLMAALTAPHKPMMTMMDGYLDELEAACDYAEEEHVRVSLVEPANEHLSRMRDMYDEACARRLRAELRFSSLMQNEPFEVKVPQLQAAVDEGREALVDDEMVNAAAALLAEATRVQRNKQVATDRLLRVCPLSNEGGGASSRLDTSDVQAAIIYAIECSVKQEIIDKCRARLQEAADMQQNIAGDVVSFFTFLRSRATKRKTRQNVMQRLSDANADCKEALKKVRRTRIADLLQDAADELAAAIDEAREKKIEATDEQHSTLATILSTAQRRTSAKTRLLEYDQAATKAMENLELTSQAAMRTILDELEMLVLHGIADEALVPVAEIEAGVQKRKALDKIWERRQTALDQMIKAQDRMDRQHDPSSVQRVAPEFETSIDRAEKLQLDDATIIAARLHRERAMTRSSITIELEAARHALKWFERAKNSNAIGNAIQALSDAVEHGKLVLRPLLESGIEVDMHGELEPIVSEGQEVLEECEKLHSNHNKASSRMGTAMQAVQHALDHPDEYEVVQVKAMVDELADAIEVARDANIPKVLIRGAQHVLTPARAAVRFAGGGKIQVAQKLSTEAAAADLARKSFRDPDAA